jgi:hypothetical protein
MPSNPCKDFRTDRGIVRLAGEIPKQFPKHLCLEFQGPEQAEHINLGTFVPFYSNKPKISVPCEIRY